MAHSLACEQPADLTIDQDLVAVELDCDDDQDLGYEDQDIVAEELSSFSDSSAAVVVLEVPVSHLPPNNVVPRNARVKMKRQSHHPAAQ